MTYTLGTLRKLGLEPEFAALVRRYIPKTVNDQEAARYVEAVLKVAEKDGLVGTAMMRQMAHMRINRAVDPGLYADIIKLHKRAAEMMRKKEGDVDLGSPPEDAEETGESPEAEKAKKTESPEVSSEEVGEENGGAGPEEEGGEESEAEEEPEVVPGVEERDFEGVKYLSAPHPMKPKSIKKYGEDFLFPVPPERLWRYKTALYKTFIILVQEPRTQDKHFKRCSRKGVTRAQFDTSWKTWQKEGKKIGWMLIEVEPEKFQLQPSKPIG